MTYPSVEPGVTLKLSTTATELKEAIILASSSAAQSFVFPLQLSNLVPTLDPKTGQVDFTDPTTGQMLALVPTGWMVDSNINKVSGQGAVSDRVSYSLIPWNGGTALQVSLDSAWLDDPSRIFPVTVDPTVVAAVDVGDDSDDTYVTSGFTNDNVGQSTFQLGTYDGGAHVSAIYDHFSGVSAYNNDNILAATLYAWNSYSWSCSARGVGVYQVTQPWGGTTMTGWPGATYGAQVGWSAFANGYTGCSANWGTWNLTSLVSQWTSGATPNFGVTLRPDPVSLSDNYAFKKFSGSAAGGQILVITYSTYNATYAVGGVTTEPTNNTPGAIAVTVTNTGHDAWPAGGTIRLSYHLYNSSLQLVTFDGARTFLPTTVQPGQSIALQAVIAPMAPAEYVIVFDMVDDGTTWFSTGPEVPTPPPDVLTVYHLSPAITATTPLNGLEVTTETPTLGVSAYSPDGWPGTALQYVFTICTGSDAASGTCFSSGVISSSTWTVPAQDLFWHTNYYWTVKVTDGAGASLTSQASAIGLVVPQPPAGSHLGVDPFSQSSGGVNPATGNYLYQTTDAAISGVGPPLALHRSYNSENTSVGDFGIGWSSIADFSVHTNTVGALVTYADGRQDQFGLNPDGSYSPGPGPFATLQTSGSGYSLIDSSATTYVTNSAGQLTYIQDAAGHRLNYTYVAGSSPSGENLTAITNATNGRSLNFTWTGRLVTTVATNSTGSGPIVWTYSYTGNELTGACAQTAIPTCTTYAYTTDGTAPVLQSITPPKGNTNVTLGYSGSGSGSISWRQDGMGNRWTYAVTTSVNRVTTIADPKGNTEVWTFDPNGHLLSQQNEDGQTRTFTWDSQGNLDVVVDENGNQIWLGHDNRGNITGRIAFTGPNMTNLVSYGYTYFLSGNDIRNGQLLTASDPRSTSTSDSTYETRYTYNADAQLISQSAPPPGPSQPSPTTTWTYSVGTELAAGGGTTPAGLLLTKTNPAGGITTYSYFSNGDLATEVDPSGLTTTYSYDGIGRLTVKGVTSAAFPSGLTTVYTYDQFNHVLTEIDPLTTDAVTGALHEKQTVTTYDANGNVSTVAVSDLRGGDATRTTTNIYNADDRIASVTDPLGRITSYTYDQLGNIQTETEPNGAVYAAMYTPTSQLATVTLDNFVDNPVNPGTPRNVILESIAYDPGGRMASKTDALGRTTAYTYDSNDLLNTTTLDNFHNPNGTTRNIVLDHRIYDAASNLISDVANNGSQVTDYTVNPDDKVTSKVFDPSTLNRTTSYGYDADGNTTSVSASGSAGSDTTQYTYSPGDQVMSQSVANGGQTLLTTVTRDQLGEVTSVTDPLGNLNGTNGYTTNYTYDQMGNRTSIISPPVNTEQVGGVTTNVRPTTTTGYNTFGNVTSAKDGNGNVTTTSYNADSELTKTVEPAYTGASSTVTPTVTQAYNPLGQVTSVTDPNGNVTTSTYDLRGRLVQKADPLVTGSSSPGLTSVTYDDANNVVGKTDPTGAAIVTSFDDRNRPVVETQAERLPATARYSSTLQYDDRGNVISSTMPDGEITTNTYDAANEVTSTTNPAGATTSHSYNFQGNPLSTTDPLGRVTSNAYSPSGQLMSTSKSSSGTVLSVQQYSYDLNGNVSTSTSPNGATTNYGFDALNRLTGIINPTSGSSSSTSTYGYDANSQRTRVTDGNGNVTTTSYNTLGLPATVVEPRTVSHTTAASSTWSTTYDANGNPTSVTEPGAVTNAATYNQMNQLVAETGAGSNAAATAAKSFSYDLNSRMTSASTPTGSQTFSYDDRGLLTSSSGTEGSSSSTYNGDGQLTNRTDAAGTAQFSYLPAGQLSTVSDPLTGTTDTQTYDQAGQLSQVSYGTSGAKEAFGYDGLGRTTSDVVTGSSGSTLRSANYAYDPNSNLTTQVVAPFTVAGAGTTSYAYNAANQLTTSTTPGGSTNYTYDLAGNRTSAGATSYTYDARNQEITSTTGASTTTQTYSARGTLATTVAPSGTTKYSFDAFNRMVKAGTAALTYDAVNRIASASSKAFSYAGASQVASSDGTSTYLRTPAGTLVSAAAGGTSSNALTNIHGDVVGNLSASGSALTSSTAYDPFGSPTAASGTAVGSVGYQGGWTVQPSGLVSMGSRFYSPSTDQFVSRDSANVPQTSALSPNDFAYVNDNPLTGTDPTGQFWGDPVPAGWISGVTGFVSAAASAFADASLAVIGTAAALITASAAIVVVGIFGFAPSTGGDCPECDSSPSGPGPGSSPGPGPGSSASPCSYGCGGGYGTQTSPNGWPTSYYAPPAPPPPPPIQVIPDVSIPTINLAPHPVNYFPPAVTPVQLTNDAAPVVVVAPTPQQAKQSDQPHIYQDEGVCIPSGPGAMSGCSPSGPATPNAVPTTQTSGEGGRGSGPPSIPSGVCENPEGGGGGSFGSSDLTGKTAAQIRSLAAGLGFLAFGIPDSQGNYRKFKDPATGQQRIRIDDGHVDPTTGQPYNDPNAAGPHAHGYDNQGNKIVDENGNPHFPLC